MQIYADDVVDFIRGLNDRLQFEMNVISVAAEVASGTKEYRPKSSKRMRFTQKTRDLIAKAEEMDRLAGRIK